MKHFLVIANGSSSELAYQLILSHDLNYMSDADFKELNFEVDEIQKMICGFIRNMK